ncbi:copper oxidase [Azotobacter chroococcum]|uniref:multicopper oxidase family protein n=1 Tax=Azotobacter chroococcum TaxID=353 RepID=UPI00103E46FA|nr:multicopper oxidase domain-containing protein [Azotobacter chroococcum]TBW07214.1 copper oxidase [Azotobacter chroococcum]
MTCTSPGRLLALSSTLALGLASQTASAAPIAESRIVREPPAAVLRGAPPEPGTPGQRLSTERQRTSGSQPEVFYDLKVRYVDGKIYNPETGQNDAVRLRAYAGEAADPQAPTPYVAPKVELWPGETFRLTLHNELPTDDSSCPHGEHDHNVPHCFNNTNIHTHGLWVSPSGNSDNVHLKIPPQTTFQYEFNVPADHPAGTFWYHSHLHGTTALQVSSGMAGPLIIRGDRLPQAKDDGSLHPGDLDTLLVAPNGRPFRERTLLFQQIAYACRDEAGAIKREADGKWLCAAGDVGGIERYDQFGIVPRGDGTLATLWSTSGRRTAINGLVEPYVVDAKAGSVERWRLIHAGVRDSIRLSFRKLDPAQASAAPGKSRLARQRFIEKACTGAPLAQFAVAGDGLTRSAVSQRDSTVLQPGYREDLLMIFPEAGTYCIVDETLRPEQSVNHESYPRELLGYVEVKGSAAGQNPETLLRQALETAARARMPQGKVRNQVLADLADGLKLGAFTPHEPVADTEITGNRTLGFQIVLAPGQAPSFEVGKIDFSSGEPEPFESAPYNQEAVQRQLTLGAVEEWKLTSFSFGHPFHIHVNPFQILSVKDPEGNEVSGAPTPGDDGIPSQYANMRGTWRDTLFVQDDHLITIRSRYRRYTGDFVLHCHILDHEDQGMMQNVRISQTGSGEDEDSGHQH